MSDSEQHLTIVGAGVLGLSTALTIQQRHPNCKVTIVAAETPALPSTWTTSRRPSADYASMWAGAHYRPIPRSTRQLNEEADIAFRTATIMYDIARKSPASSVQIMPAVEYLEYPPAENLALKTGDLYAGPDDQFRILDKKELPEGVKWGCEYEAYCLDVHKYCSWLLNNFIEAGGKVVQQRLQSIQDVFEQPYMGPPSIVINCSGRNMDQDPKTKIIRGQTVLVANKYHRTITRQTSDGGWVFLIPRPGGSGTIVGGTKEIDDLETNARPETRQKLLTEAVKAFPDFVDNVSKFQVVMDNVGRRPWREGGLRIESEQLQQDRTVIHGYGAGGRGYELSWGAAERIADLYQEALEGSSARAHL